jgi:hypothetical protein
MNNITSAKSSLQAELAHVQSGLAYYQSRVEALSAALHQLDEIEEHDELEVEETSGKARGRKAAAQKSRAGKTAGKSAKAGRPRKSGSRLPSTGGDFFPGLLSDQRQTMAELLRGAAAQLPFKPSADELKQLRARLVAAITAMLQAGKVHDEGRGRQRTFVKV